MSRAFRLGLFIAGTLTVLAIFIFLIGNNESRFRSTYSLKAQFQNVGGLNDGADVRVGGIHKGTVRHIDLPSQPDGKVTVFMDLETPTRDIVKKDSAAAIKSEGLLGDKYIEVSFGSKDAPKVKDGDTIASQPPLDIADVMKKTDELLDTAKGALGNIEGAAGNLEAISTKINKGQGTAGALINDKTMYKNVAGGASAFRDDMEALKHNFLLRGFFKKRGYEDPEDLSKHEIAKVPPDPPVKTFVYDATRIFDQPDTAKLKNPKALKEAGIFLEENKFGLAVVEASTDKGDSDKDRVLTEARALVARDYLVNHFQIVDDTRIKTLGIGKAADGSKLQILVYR
jgi:phospholipid/cholesterol/gamma-HCH transport system substrate-binding protein